MQENYQERQRRKQREEDAGLKACTHGKDYWCSNCVSKGVTVDWRKEGLGRGHIFTNCPPEPDNPNGSNSTASNIYE